MEYFKTIEGMLSHQFEKDGEKDDNGKPIIATEQPMTEAEYIEFKKAEVAKKLLNKYK